MYCFEINGLIPGCRNIVYRPKDEILKSFRRTRLPSTPTHNSSGILNLVIVSLDHQLPKWQWHTFRISPDQYSDHSLLDIHLPQGTVAPVLEVFHCRPWNRFNKALFQTSLQSSVLCDCHFLSTFVPIDELANTYYSVLSGLLDRILPIATICRRVNPLVPWFDSDCVAAKRFTAGQYEWFGSIWASWPDSSDRHHAPSCQSTCPIVRFWLCCCQAIYMTAWAYVHLKSRGPHIPVSKCWNKHVNCKTYTEPRHKIADAPLSGDSVEIPGPNRGPWISCWVGLPLRWVDLARSYS